jgi:hypothetical protein
MRPQSILMTGSKISQPNWPRLKHVTLRLMGVYCLAYQHGKAVGCIAVLKMRQGVAELKRSMFSQISGDLRLVLNFWNQQLSLRWIYSSSTFVWK